MPGNQPGSTTVLKSDVRLGQAKNWRLIRFGKVCIYLAKAAFKPLPENELPSLIRRLGQSFTAGGHEFEKTAIQCISGFEGHFAVVIAHPQWVVCAVDRIRSIPLVFGLCKDGRLRIAQTADQILGDEAVDRAIRPEQVLSVALSGYTIGIDTIYRDACALIPGQIMFATAGSPRPKIRHYSCFSAWRATAPESDGEEAESQKLSALTLWILNQLVERADGRQIAVPLSAGLDSRLIVSGLYELGYQNVTCFAYGRKDNHEAAVSKDIANRLGYKWNFVEYSNRKLARTFFSGEYERFRRYSDSLTGVHFPQDYLALKQLSTERYISPDAIIVNGQSGDFITGNHIPETLADAGSHSRSDVLDCLVTKHFKQWPHLANERNFSVIRNLLNLAIDEYMGEDAKLTRVYAHGVYEASEFMDRQAKYVVNGQRLYEFLGYDWDLPLWHDRYLSYWSERSLDDKYRQKHYRIMLQSMNWGGVWNDVPINEKRLRPRWIIPVRLLFKALHLFSSKYAWHQFERSYLEYFMSPLCGYALRSWSGIVRDGRRPHTAIAPHIEDYLLSHGVSIDTLGAGGAR